MHGVQGVDLFRDALDADFRRNGRAGPGRDHDGGKHRSQFPDQRQGHQGPQGALCPYGHQGVVGLEPQDHAGEEAHQEDDRHGPGADFIDLISDLG